MVFDKRKAGHKSEVRTFRFRTRIGFLSLVLSLLCNTEFTTSNIGPHFSNSDFRGFLFLPIFAARKNGGYSSVG